MLAAQIFMLLVSVALSLCAWSGLRQAVAAAALHVSDRLRRGIHSHRPGRHPSATWCRAPKSPGAVALNSMGFNIARSVGPAIGGAIVAAAGAAAAFAVNAASYIALLTVLARWRPPTRTHAAAARDARHRDGGGRSLRRDVARHSHGAGSRAVFGFGASSILALLPLVAKHLVAGGPLTYGLLLGAFGVGAVTGALGAARLRDVLSTEAIVRWAAASLALAAAIMAVSTNLALTMAVLLLGGAGWVLAFRRSTSRVQMSAPRWVVARALSLYQMAAFGGMAAGSWLWGEAAARRRHQRCTAGLSGVVLVACAARPLGAAVASGRAEPRSAARIMWNAPTTAVPVDARTGPVVITIEYIIDESDIEEFLAAWPSVGASRRRDGARNWRLLRDLADPRLWIERYETPTWLDYIRLNNRLTQDDASFPTRLRALHRGTEGPRVRRMIERQTSSPPIPGQGSEGATTDL